MREVRDTMNTMKGGFSFDDSGHPADPPAGSRLSATNGDAAAPDGAGAAVEVPAEPEPEPVAAVAEPEPPAPPAPARRRSRRWRPRRPSPRRRRRNGTEPAHHEPAPENEHTA